MGKKSAKKQKVSVVFVLDETGSMEVCKKETISGFNEYIGTLKQKTEDIKFSLTKFNSHKIELVYDGVALKYVEDLNETNYKPSDNTPLYDAIGKTIVNLKKVKGKVLFVVMTDGEENASHEFTSSVIKDMIKDKENRGWSFVFLGANQDAWLTGQRLGYSLNNVATYDIKNTGRAFQVLASNTSSYCANNGEVGAMGYFSKKDKEEIK